MLLRSSHVRRLTSLVGLVMLGAAPLLGGFGGLRFHASLDRWQPDSTLDLQGKGHSPCERCQPL